MPNENNPWLLVVRVSDPINKATHWFLSQTVKENKWKKRYTLHKLTAEKINQAETHSLKTRSKALPLHSVTAKCKCWTHSFANWLMRVFSYSSKNRHLSDIHYTKPYDKFHPVHISAYQMRIIYMGIEKSAWGVPSLNGQGPRAA